MELSCCASLTLTKLVKHLAVIYMIHSCDCDGGKLCITKLRNVERKSYSTRKGVECTKRNTRAFFKESHT